jgi:predicted adenylyl cyclase CyaB
MPTYEIEIKSLIGDKQAAIDLADKMRSLDSNFVARGHNSQLNHYFIKGNLQMLREKLGEHLPSGKQTELAELVTQAKDFSVRTRRADNLVLFVIKATVDDTTSSNGTARIEYEAEVKIPLDILDHILLECGFEYQAKWSRERDEYSYKGFNVTIDKNAGYGFLAEFEAIVDDPNRADAVKTQIRQVMQELGVKELAQERLERMFKYYNEHWQDYYGTDKTFSIE